MSVEHKGQSVLTLFAGPNKRAVRFTRASPRTNLSKSREVVERPGRSLAVAIPVKPSAHLEKAVAPRLPASAPLTASSQDPNRLLTEREVADRLQMAASSLRNWRTQGRGPKWLALSRRAVRYRAADVEEWLEARQRRSTSDAGNGHE